MSDLSIVRLGHPALRMKSTRVKNNELLSNNFQKFLDELIQVCLQNDGVGIAAPQVNVNKRVIIIHVDPKNPRYKNKPAFPLTVVINPIILKKSNTIEEDWEGDLSCNLRALVPRPNSCEISGYSREGEPIKFTLLEPFHARVFLHEIDHLNGRFLLDRVKDYKSISELTEWKKYWKNKKRI